MRISSRTRFNELFSGLEQFTDAEQEQKIGEMNEVVDGMNADELLSIINEEMFNKIHEMIEEKKNEENEECRNLTRLVYQSAWEFLISRLDNDESLNEVIMNELHFARETITELEELTRNMDWKRKKGEEMSKEEAKEEFALLRWVETLGICFQSCRLKNEELAILFGGIIQTYRAAKDYCRDISSECIRSLRNAAENRDVKIEDLLKEGAVDAVLEEMQRGTVDDKIICNCLYFLMNISKRLKEKEQDETEKEKRNEMKRKIFEKLEEEGYEDSIIGLHNRVIEGMVFSAFHVRNN
ncbi:uncharacterized protein MONOS_18145 [Monocercomonoides exilis]|uniref:uncharacterized protein n=1 Tax=Monocercomonoides exilis TaxID=2049356 RepID=UPI00355A39A2|nr:hypothetical protein MONOS_18145 [Monocercomonoides exilis]